MGHRRKEKHFKKRNKDFIQTTAAALITFFLCMVVIFSLAKKAGFGPSLTGSREDLSTAAETDKDQAEDQSTENKKDDQEAVKYKNAGEVPKAPGAPEIIEDYLEPNKYSRSQKVLKKVKGIVVHFVDNPGSTAKENRNYFNNLGKTHVRKASSHFIIGLEGEIIQCIPLGEVAYASKTRNKDTISIECCHEDSGGKFNKKTARSLVRLADWLCRTYNITEEQVIRHYDVTGKMCPRYYVEHPKAWKKLKKRIRKKIARSLKKYSDKKEMN